MTIPDYQSLMLPLLKQAARGETRVPEVADKLADDLGITAEERDQLQPSASETAPQACGGFGAGAA